MNINDIKIEQFPSRKYFKGIANDIDDMREFMQYCNIAQSKLNLDNKIKFFKTHNAFWRTGKYSTERNEHISSELSLEKDDEVLGYLYVGTPEVEASKIPELDNKDFVTVWD